jgi:two-component system sensor histidine kinase UhpB
MELEQKRTGEELRKSEWQLRVAQRLAHVGSWERDMQTNRIALSEEGARIFFGDEHRKSTSWDELVAVVHPSDRERAFQTRHVSDSTTVGELEFRIVKPDGAVRRIYACADVVRDDEGRPVKLLGTHMDITERHRAETELREKKEELQALSRRLLETQEAERRLLARELHDSFGQLLTAIRLNLHALGAESERVAESIALIDQANELVRNLALDLRPSILDDLGLEAALRWLLNRQSKRAGFAGTFVAQGPDGRLPADIETCCFRLAQEALTNVARHAGAQHVAIDLDIRPTEVTISIRDDGRGFDVRAGRERAVSGSSLGLLSMEERVSLAGGRLDIQSKPSFGTTVFARFPLAGGGASHEGDQSSCG